MADTNSNNSTDRNTETTQREQAGFEKDRKSEQGQSGQSEQGGFDKDRKSEQGQSGQREQGGFDKDRQEKSAIGGEQKSETGQTTGQFDKNRSEPTSR